MRKMRLFAFFMTITLLAGIVGINMTSGKGANCVDNHSADSSNYEMCVIEEQDDREDSDSSVYDYDFPAIPMFVKNLMVDADWWADTLCAIRGKVYYTAYETYGRTHLLYNEDQILATDPTLQIYSYATECEDKFYVSVVAKTLLADFPIIIVFRL